MEPTEKKGIFSRLKNGLKKTREGFVTRMDHLFLGKVRLDAETLDEFEEVLLTADIGVQTTTRLIQEVEKRTRHGELEQPGVLKRHIREIIGGILTPREAPLVIGEEKPFVLMVIGVNGVGKTTTIAKLGKQWIDQGKKVTLVAGDTFRAAAIEQLEFWGDKIGAEVIRQQQGSDPSSVVYDAVQSAKSKDTDIVILDTAGRLHTKVNLMDELKKIKRVTEKVYPGAPHEVLLVLDATIGQNALSQAELFNNALGVTGLALTKLDGTAKGGVIVAVAAEMDIPIRFIGVGEKVDDLQQFKADFFMDALFGESEEDE